MQLTFRHGIIRRQTDILNTPTFLRKSSPAGNYIDLIVSPDPTVITMSHGESNYLIEESKTVTQAWGPFAVLGQTQYLFWDVSLLDGSITHGYTLLPLMVTGNTPAAPAVDQHWFDLNDMVMKVWNGTKWTIKLRLFAATYDSSAIILPFPLGTQVGISNVENKAGNIMLARDNKPLRNSVGEFVTTESSLTISHASAESVKFETAVIHAGATEYIPKFSLVSFIGPRQMALASSNNVSRYVSGIVLEDFYEGEVGIVIPSGVVRNDQWSFTHDQIGKPVFCSMTGEITLTPPTSGISQIAGQVHDADTIYMNILTPTIL